MPVLIRKPGGPAVAARFETAWNEGTGADTPSSAAWAGWKAPARGAARSGLFETCANPGCGSGWLHLWRSRSAPVFEGGWSCSATCTAACMEAAVRRELEGRGSAQESHRHRIPLGLVMLEQGGSPAVSYARRWTRRRGRAAGGWAFGWCASRG
jgi:hypothetical protein